MSGELDEGLESSSGLPPGDEDAITKPSGSSPDLQVRPRPAAPGAKNKAHTEWGMRLLKTVAGHVYQFP